MSLAVALAPVPSIAAELKSTEGKSAPSKSSKAAVVDSAAVARRIGPQPLTSIYNAVGPYASSGSVLSIDFAAETDSGLYVVKVLKKNGRRLTLVLDARTLSLISRK